MEDYSDLLKYQRATLRTTSARTFDKQQKQILAQVRTLKDFAEYLATQTKQ